MSMNLSEDEWKKKLTKEQYAVLRQSHTESPFTGKLLHNDASGDYKCAACGAVVFKADTKFDSGSGWPSFYDPANIEAVKLKEDTSIGTTRVEVTCANCGSHLGHVFKDAPDQPTGMRFCINSAALDFEEKQHRPDSFFNYRANDRKDGEDYRTSRERNCCRSNKRALRDSRGNV
jgi:peptide-methionine (R)-S-oxide reductase